MLPYPLTKSWLGKLHGSDRCSTYIDLMEAYRRGGVAYSIGIRGVAGDVGSIYMVNAQNGKEESSEGGNESHWKFGLFPH